MAVIHMRTNGLTIPTTCKGGRCPIRTPVRERTGRSLTLSATCSLDAQSRLLDRRSLLLSTSTIFTALAAGPALAEDITILSEVEGFGKHPAQKGDLLLFHYVGTLEATGQVFDSTRGGLPYRDGGMGVMRPAAVQLGSGPVPGLCGGLRLALEGMRVGGKRTISVPPQLGFGNATVGAPYAVVPPGSALRYEVELVRLSARGPDELTTGIVKCGTGGASESVERCGEIEPAEFV